MSTRSSTRKPRTPTTPVVETPTSTSAPEALVDVETKVVVTGATTLMEVQVALDELYESNQIQFTLADQQLRADLEDWWHTRLQTQQLLETLSGQFHYTPFFLTHGRGPREITLEEYQKGAAQILSIYMELVNADKAVRYIGTSGVRSLFDWVTFTDYLANHYDCVDTFLAETSLADKYQFIGLLSVREADFFLLDYAFES